MKNVEKKKNRYAIAAVVCLFILLFGNEKGFVQYLQNHPLTVLIFLSIIGYCVYKYILILKTEFESQKEYLEWEVAFQVKNGLKKLCENEVMVDAVCSEKFEHDFLPSPKSEKEYEQKSMTLFKEMTRNIIEEYCKNHYLIRLSCLLDGEKRLEDRMYEKCKKDMSYSVYTAHYMSQFAYACLCRMGMATMSEFVYANQFYFSEYLGLSLINSDSQIDKKKYTENPYDLFLLSEEKMIDFQLKGKVYQEYSDYFKRVFDENNVEKISLGNNLFLFNSGDEGVMNAEKIVLEL